MQGMVEGYEGPNDMVLENGEPRTMFQRSYQKCPIQRIGKTKGNMVGKDVWKWKDGVKAIVWRK